ncbi:hypothetical protein GYH30_019349 [Glycine max]|uniref:Uncharacterized protein n=1 Tax=Glycine max TaxID=3847 RepID=K7L3G4_SOYBN|nr:hypothetical protein GYH30_019349 [Glycine max]
MANLKVNSFLEKQNYCFSLPCRKNVISQPPLSCCFFLNSLIFRIISVSTLYTLHSETSLKHWCPLSKTPWLSQIVTMTKHYNTVVLIPFSAFWLRSSVVSVLISLISDMWIIGPHGIKLLF